MANTDNVTLRRLEKFHTNCKSEFALSDHTQALTAGGTGQSFADFPALCDAVGSGGNWVDVSTKLKNGITILDSRFSVYDVIAYIYENRYLCCFIVIHGATSTSAGSQPNIAKFPTWARPKTDSTSGFVDNGGATLNASIYSDGTFCCYFLCAQPSPCGVVFSNSYPLATPYNPS